MTPSEANERWFEPVAPPAPAAIEPPKPSRRAPTQATQLVELALDSDGFEVFRTSGLEPYALVPTGTHREVWPVKSAAFRRWLSGSYFKRAHGVPGGQALTDALGVLEGRALFDGAEAEVHLRLAEHDGAVYLDLCDEYWQACKITARGWEIVHDAPVRFRRTRGMQSLPRPVEGGSIDELNEFVNVPGADWPLFLGWLLGALRPRGPYSVLLVHGEQGAGKSALTRVARKLIDPNEAPIRREPRNGQDLIVAARNGLIVAFDNVSHLSPELSDDLARLATGSGFGARQLYTDLDEVIVHVSRPIILNGIEEVAVRGDLLDRGLILNLPTIPSYQDEDGFWGAFETARPRILGALLDAVATALDRQGRTPTPNVRMADFARWVTAAEPALGLETGSFMAAYEQNRAGAVQLTLESSMLSGPVTALAETGFEGTATALLKRLDELVSEETRRQRYWPKRPHTLSGQLNRLAPALRRVGVAVEISRGRAARRITISTRVNSSVTSVTERHGASPPGHSVTLGDARDALLHTCTDSAEAAGEELERLEGLGEELGLL